MNDLDKNNANERKIYEFVVNDESYRTDDAKLKGKDVRTESGHDPAANFRLIAVMDRYTTSVGLEDSVELKVGEKRIFRIFENDRDYDFTVDDLGWEWGAASISESDVRKYGRIQESREIVVEGPVERVIPRGGAIELSRPGVERIYSRRIANPSHFEVIFIIGGEPQKVGAERRELLVDVLKRALDDSENTGRPVEDWRVTDEPGSVLDVTKTLAELGVTSGMVLIASLKTGEAG